VRKARAVGLLLAALVSSSTARADDASAALDADAAEDAGSIPFRKFVMVPDPHEDASAPAKPPPGPSFRGRSGRSRRTSTGSGALIIFVLVGGIGYYVVKRLRR
jgi:hypothetical protein